MRIFANPEQLRDAVGQTLGPGAAYPVDQHRIQAFADATDDHQWIHLDAERAAAGPFGATIAHGFLTLSLLPTLLSGLYRLENVAMGINYGLNKVRFPAPLRSGMSVTATAVISAVEPMSADIVQVVTTVTITEIEATKPCCVAESVARMSFYS